MIYSLVKTNGVKAAFELIIDEIKSVVKNNSEIGSKAFSEQNYDEASARIEYGQNLKTFQLKVKALLSEWEQKFSLKNEVNKKKGKFHNKNAPTRFYVTFPEKETIRAKCAADTFALTIKKIGVEKVRHLNLSTAGIPLITSSKHDKLGQRNVNGWYVCTHSSTEQKVKLLKTISQKLGVKLEAGVI